MKVILFFGRRYAPFEAESAGGELWWRRAVRGTECRVAVAAVVGGSRQRGLPVCRLSPLVVSCPVFRSVPAVMGSKVEYVESSHMYATNYVRNSKAIGVLWGIFTICYAIIVIVALVTPEWIGDTRQTEASGRFGLWTRCHFPGGGGAEVCVGGVHDLSSAPSDAFRAAAVLVAGAAVLALVAIVAMLLFFFVPATKVFHVCAWLQVFSGESFPPL